MAPPEKQPPAPFPSDRWVWLFVLLVLAGIVLGAMRLPSLQRFAATPRPAKLPSRVSPWRPPPYKPPQFNLRPLPGQGPGGIPGPVLDPLATLQSLQSRPPLRRTLPRPSQSGPPLTASFTDVAVLPDSIGNLYFVGMYKNTSSEPHQQPRVEVTLWDAEHRKLQVNQGFAPRSHLGPGEETPIKVLVASAPQYASVTYNMTPRRPFFPHRRLRLEMRDTRLGRGRFGGYEVRGVVVNTEATESVRFVRIIALLRDKQGRIVGMGDSFIGQRVLAAGEDCPFTVGVPLVRGMPASFQLDYAAMTARGD